MKDDTFGRGKTGFIVLSDLRLDKKLTILKVVDLWKIEVKTPT